MDEHQSAQHLIADLFVDGLDVERRDDLEAHLAGCSPCRRVLDDYTALTSSLASVRGSAAARGGEVVTDGGAGAADDHRRVVGRDLGRLAVVIAAVAVVLTGAVAAAVLILL